MRSSMKVFLEKGYKNTTIKDLVIASGLSSGGFYHYYSDKSEVLHDIMAEGNRYRFNIMMQYAKSNPHATKQELFTEIILGKLLDDNEMKDIYIIFLQELQYDETLRKLYNDMMLEFRSEYTKYCRENNLELFQKINTDFFIGLMNSIYLGIRMLDLKEVFLKDKEKLKKILMVLIEEDEEGMSRE